MEFIERKIVFHRKHFINFYLKQTIKIQEKIEYVFRIIRLVERIPEKFLKKVEGTNKLYETRVDFGSNTLRIFCCFDKNNFVVIFNAFQKKTRKIPKKEIELAERLMKEYLRSKGGER